MAQTRLRKDDLFNAETTRQIAGEYAAAIPGFDAEACVAAALAGYKERELLARLDWLATCVGAQLAADFPTLADQLEAALPPPLDPTKRDGDFGHFIHAVPGVLAVRHGLDAHPARALDLLHAATKRVSMEFYIRPFLRRWPEETLARLSGWAEDKNYHVRRLVSEGTRPRLPWAARLDLPPSVTLPLLDRLAADPTRYVTRSVANHLNDLGKTDPEPLLARLNAWRAEGRQEARELAWMTRHALRSLVKAGHPGALACLGYREVDGLRARVRLAATDVEIGSGLEVEVTLSAPRSAPVLVDYILHLPRAGGRITARVYKLATAVVPAGTPLVLRKAHRLKGDATTFTLAPGAARLEVQVNGRIVDAAAFTLARALTP